MTARASLGNTRPMAAQDSSESYASTDSFLLDEGGGGGAEGDGEGVEAGGSAPEARQRVRRASSTTLRV